MNPAIERGSRLNVESVEPKTVIPPSTRGRFHDFKRLALRLLGSAGLIFSPLIVACSPDTKAVSPNLNPEPRPAAAAPAETPTAVASGGGEVVKSNNIEQRINSGQATPDEIREFNRTALERATVTSWMTEKGEVKQLPQIEGLRTIQQVINTGEGYKLSSVYVAKAENPYGLEESQLAGIFHPEVFDVKDETTSEQVGSVGLKAEVVRKMMKDAGSPTTNVAIPLGVDLTTSSPVDKKVLVQQTQNPSTKLITTWVRYPEGSKIVICLPNETEPVKVTFLPQKSGFTVVDYTKPTFKGDFDLRLYYADSLPVTTVNGPLGDELFVVGSKTFPTDTDVVRKLNYPAPVNGLNISMSGLRLYTDDAGNLPKLDITKANLLRVDGSYVSFMANANPSSNSTGKVIFP